MAGKSIGQRGLRALLRADQRQVRAWLSKGRFPKRSYWARIIAAGIATETELLEWRPRRKPRSGVKPASYFIRGARVFSLAECAARVPPVFPLPSASNGAPVGGGVPAHATTGITLAPSDSCNGAALAERGGSGGVSA